MMLENTSLTFSVMSSYSKSADSVYHMYTNIHSSFGFANFRSFAYEEADCHPVMPFATRAPYDLSKHASIHLIHQTL